MSFLQKINSGVKILLIMLILFGTFNSVINIHYHKSADGQIIVHSHPFTPDFEKGTPFQKHKHTKEELIFLSIINLSTLILSLIVAYIFIEKIMKLSISHIYNFSKIDIYPKYANTLRGPPLI